MTWLGSVWRLFIWVLGAAIVVAALTLSRWWLPLPGEWLDVSEPVEPADIIFVASGQALWRAKKAAELYNERLAPRVVAAGGGESELLLFVTGERISDAEVVGRILAHLGVPKGATTLVDGVTSTREDAEAFKEYVQAHQVRSAIVVTSHLHSRRARWTFGRVLNDPSVKVQFVEADQPDVKAATWWQGEDGLVTVFNEYLKYAFYLARY